MLIFRLVYGLTVKPENGLTGDENIFRMFNINAGRRGIKCVETRFKRVSTCFFIGSGNLSQIRFQQFIF